MAPKGRPAGKAQSKKEPMPKAKAKEEPAAKRRKKKSGETDPPIEQLPPEQVAKYQTQWEKFGLQAKKDKDTKVSPHATVENDQQAQSSGSGGGKQELVLVKQATCCMEYIV